MSGTNLRAWLFRILRNIYLHQRQSRPAPAPAPLAASPSSPEFTGGGLHSGEHHVLVRAELRAVVEAFRQLRER